jgi:cysteine-rich repeat protein
MKWKRMIRRMRRRKKWRILSLLVPLLALIIGIAASIGYLPLGAFEPPPRSVCGNGIIEYLEQCDDNNTATDDGCENCQTALGDPSIFAVAISEPSGIAWHPYYHTFIVVDDGGSVYFWDGENATVQLLAHGLGNLKSVAVADGESPLFYLGKENCASCDNPCPATIREISVENDTVTIHHEFEIPIEDIPACGNGLGGLAIVYGQFYAAYNTNGEIYVYDRMGNALVKERSFSSGHPQITGLHYHEPEYALYALFGGKQHKLRRIDLFGSVLYEADGRLSEWSLSPKNAQEGIYRLGNRLILADNLGVIRSYPFVR